MRRQSKGNGILGGLLRGGITELSLRPSRFSEKKGIPGSTCLRSKKGTGVRKQGERSWEAGSGKAGGSIEYTKSQVQGGRSRAGREEPGTWRWPRGFHLIKKGTKMTQGKFWWSPN